MGGRRSHGWELRHLNFDGGVVSASIVLAPTEFTRLSTWRHSSHESNGAISRCNFLPHVHDNWFCHSSISSFSDWKTMQQRTVWHDMIGKHCPIFAVNREVS